MVRRVRGLTGGLPALVAAVLWMGSCATIQSTPLPSGEAVRGATPIYELVPPDGWARVTAGSDEQFDLALVGRGSMVIVRVRPSAGGSLDDAVAARRQVVAKRGLQDYHERRFFLERSDLVPASLARYGLSGKTGAGSTVQVLTVVSERGVIEVFGSGGADQEAARTALMTSLRLLE